MRCSRRGFRIALVSFAIDNLSLYVGGSTVSSSIMPIRPPCVLGSNVSLRMIGYDQWSGYAYKVVFSSASSLAGAVACTIYKSSTMCGIGLSAINEVKSKQLVEKLHSR